MSDRSLHSQSLHAYRIALFEPNPDLATNPSLVGLASSLLDEGASLDIFMPDEGPYPQIPWQVPRYPFPRGDKLTVYRVPVALRQRLQLRRWRQHGVPPAMDYD